mmetsp:Transcript_14566/g.40019  ORF Transcript_14566/g.40019 Transcript_14566/m.40019 type:complete len:647 (-) Transcript_14566:234-2174(-)
MCRLFFFLVYTGLVCGTCDIGRNATQPVEPAGGNCSFNQGVYFGDFLAPSFCRDVAKTDTTLRGIFCYPTLGYSAVEVVIVWTLIIAWRLLGRGMWHRYQRHEEEVNAGRGWRHAHVHFDTPPSPAASAGLNRYHMPADRLSDVVPEPATWRSVFDGLGRCVVQLLQWWLFMGLHLIYLLVCELLALFNHHHLSLDVSTMTVTFPDALRSKISDPLLMFSFSAFGAIIVTYCICLTSIILQCTWHFKSKMSWDCSEVAEHWAGMICLSRERAVQVLLLPMVYGVMCGKNVSGTWSLVTENYMPALDCIGNWNATEQAQIQSSTMDTNYQLGDLFEAWALYNFATLVGRVLRPELVKKVKPLVLETFTEILLIDVQVFVVISGASSVLSIIPIWTQWRRGATLGGQMLASLNNSIYGANFIVSCIAIKNIWMVERRFEPLKTMKHFSPGYKFLSIKLMVLVAFWMQIIRGVMQMVLTSDLNTLRLLDASVRAWIMMIVALLQFFAWRPTDPWYAAVNQAEADERTELATRKHRQSGEGEDGFMELGQKHVPPGVVSLVENLFTGTGESTAEDFYVTFDAEDLKQVKDHIQELKEEDMWKVLYRGSLLGWAQPLVSGPRGRISILDLDSHEDRLHRLMEHLQSFYPDL